ncbi:lipopolysaccharide biosynthesis protein [uncultured Draconibacterium sp.]|uniref:lipopolysaccharide biosynthesis protein n=1 Tax=uncultured Draconibacterium sp. TaxID=1573823 RepID=UPI002AA8542F|nr:lipopolysaccharide biosynthesis protein [uncultured Draconibacterium sp.]
MNLKQEAAKGIVWKFIENGGTQAIQFISGIYIARILSPDDYGLVGMMAIFLGISQSFIDSGFRATLIQKGKEITPDHYNVVFLFNLVISCIFYLLIFVGAPYIADFYHEPQLILVARIFGLNLIFVSLGIIHQTIFEKKIKFRTLSKIRLVAVSLSALTGIIAAKMGFGVWALIVMSLLETAITTIILWIINRWYPSFRFNFNVFKELYSKSIQIFFAGILTTISDNLYTMMIGKYFSTADVGFFSQGKKLQRRINVLINNSFQSVMYPVQSLMKDDIPRLKNTVRRNVNLTAFFTFPCLIGLIAIAKPFVLIALTEKWAPSVYFIQVLSVAGILSMLKSPISSYIKPMGKFNLVLVFSVLRNVFFIAFLFIGILFKVQLKVLVLGIIISEITGFLWILFYAKRIINYKLKEIIEDFISPLIFSIVMGIVIFFIGEMFAVTLMVLIMQVLIGCLIYLFLTYIFNRLLYKEMKEILNKMIKIKS